MERVGRQEVDNLHWVHEGERHRLDLGVSRHYHLTACSLSYPGYPSLTA